MDDSARPISGGQHPRSPAGVETRAARVTVWAALRAAIAVAIVLATVDQVSRAMRGGSEFGWSGAEAVGRLFSFFTVLSNVLAALVLLWAVAATFAGRYRRDGRILAFALASVTTYMLVTGLVYNVVLRAAGGADIMLGWSNDVHHIYAPAFLLLDALIGPGRRRLPWRALGAILVFPLLWVSYTLVRGPSLSAPDTGEPPWYPYPFLDPREVGGYGGVALWVVGIAAVILLLAWFVVAVGRRRDRAAPPVGSTGEAHGRSGTAG